MSEGVAHLGRGMQQFGQSLLNAAPHWRRPEPTDEINRQELLQAQQYWNRRFNEWQHDNMNTRFDQIGDNYEDFVEAFRGEMAAPDRWSSPSTAEAFNFWYEESASARRLPVATQAQQAKAAYNTQLYESNLESAVTMRDTEGVVAAVQAGVADGTIAPEAAANVISDSVYAINLAQIHDDITAFAQTHGYDAAVMQLDEIKPEDVPAFTVGVDADGQPVQRKIDRADLDRIKADVRGELSRARSEQTYRINETDRIFDEQANLLFTDRSLPDLLAFKSWLEGVDPRTGEQVSDDQNPRLGMKSPTWRTWWGMVNKAIDDEYGNMDAASRAAVEEDRSRFFSEWYRAVNRGEDPQALREILFQGLERGLIGETETRTLVSYENTHNENPVFDGVRKEVEFLARTHEISPAQQARVWEAFHSWFMDDAIRRTPDGEWAYNPSRTSSEDMARIAHNIFYSKMDEDVRKDVRHAYSIEQGMINPALNQRTGVMGAVRDEAHVDEAEAVLAAVQRGEYLGWEAMAPSARRQLETLAAGHTNVFTGATGIAPIETYLDAKGQPIMQARDQYDRLRYFRFNVPLGDDGQPIIERRVFGSRLLADEQPQVFDAERGLWYDVELRPSAPGSRVHFTIRDDRPGMTP